MEAFIISKVSGWEDHKTILKVFIDKEQADAYLARLNVLLAKAKCVYGKEYHDEDKFDIALAKNTISRKDEEMGYKKAIRQMHLNDIVTFTLEIFPITE